MQSRDQADAARVVALKGAGASSVCVFPTCRILKARDHLVVVTDEIGKAEVNEQEDQLEHVRQAAIYQSDVRAGLNPQTPAPFAAAQLPRACCSVP